MLFMKYISNFILIIVLLSFNTSRAQINLNGYKYVFMPTLTYNDGSKDIWSISSMFRAMFIDKGFIIVDGSLSIRDQIRKDPCLLIRCEINHTNVTVGSNKVTLTLKNCKDEVIYSNTGSAMGLSVQDDFNKATRRAFDKIKSTVYVFDPSLTPTPILGQVDKTEETESSLKTYFEENKIDPIEGIYKTYQEESMGYYKIGIKKVRDKYLGIVIESDSKYWKPGEVKAYFESSSMRGLYSTTWYSGNKAKNETFATLDNDALLSIEFKNSDGSKRLSKLVKVYPTDISDNTVKKKITKSSGSGFFISSNGLIATNAHVIENSKNIEIKITNELGTFTYKAKVELKDSKNDVAILKIDDAKFKGLNAIPYDFIDRAEIGERTFTLGYPLNDVMGSNFKLTDGIVSSTSGIGDDLRYYQITVPIQPGNSGGPLFNSDGNIIGLTTAKLNSNAVGTSIENVNYAIKVQYLINIINMLPSYSNQKSDGLLKGKELKEQVKTLKNYICLIEVSE